jgi:glyoxylase-like metal-dependent hydrolase (beta-lactamase superfamily II)/8-oxo-dGTP pyrophosphatase MutT (NUDIX family)
VGHIAKPASVLLLRGEDPPEIYLVHRSAQLRFLGGFGAFPGGKVCPEDRLLSFNPGPTATAALARDAVAVGSGLNEPAAGELVAAAARELFEETGVLVARRGDGSQPHSGSSLTYMRRKMMEEKLAFAEVLKRLELGIAATDFEPLGSITTPPFVPTRFNTAFFLARLPEGQEATVWPGELESGEWLTARQAVEQWTRGNSLLSPPTLLILQAIQDLPSSEISSRLAEQFETWNREAVPAIPFAPGVELIPLDTKALPPSTHTNAYLVGSGPRYLIDPGTAIPEEQERLFGLLDRKRARGEALAGVVLTHHHPDHIGAAAVCALRYGVPIYAHPVTARLLEGKVPVQWLLNEGDRLDLGAAPDGGGPWHLQVLLTPGHAPGHLAFYESKYRLLFAGDMISTLSSVVIAPPQGDLVQYLDSLRRLHTYDCRLLLPSHGSPSARPRVTIQECIDHRLKREEQLLASLAGGPKRIPQLAEALYKGLQPSMMRFAELQVLAGLKKLEQESKVEAVPTSDGDLWRRTAGTGG